MGYSSKKATVPSRAQTDLRYPQLLATLVIPAIA
jgi:hypothetical protein